MARDQQRQRLYDSEQRVRRAIDRGDAPADRIIDKDDVEAAQRYVTRAVERAAAHADVFLGLHGGALETVPTVFVHRKTDTASHYRQGTRIGLPPRKWAWRGAVLTHEVAHHLTVSALPSHGPVFAHNFVQLLRLTESRTLGNLLRQQFDHDGILHGKDAAIERAIRYSRKILAEAWGAYEREESLSEFPTVDVTTFSGSRFTGDLVQVDPVDGITVLRPWTDTPVEIAVEHLAEVNQVARTYRP